MTANQTEQPRAKILIVDDISLNLRMLSDTLEPQGYDILAAPSGEIALQIAARRSPDLILLDVMMPGGIDGFETCRRLKKNSETAAIPVIFVTAKGETSSIVDGFEAGGVDYIAKPFEQPEVLARVETHLSNARLTRELRQMTRELLQKNEELEREISLRRQAEDARLKSDEQLSLISEQEAKRWGIPGFIGTSHTIAKIIEEVRQLQDVGTTSVLIMGESGTGKELIARAIHFGGADRKRPFIPVNCSAIPAELAESSFFGHVKGAFTGATTTRKGYFELADGGTLFLDEIGDMPLQLQAKLLRVLEDGRIMPVGGAHEKQINVRLLAATNANLPDKIAAGTFRSDLYFRLAGFTVTVPSLRDRREDIPLLANHFLEMLATEMGLSSGGVDEGASGGVDEGASRRVSPHPSTQTPVHPNTQTPASPPTLSPAALDALMNYPFPGNVRELRNIIEHALIRSRGSAIQPEHLHFIELPPVDTATPEKTPQPDQTPTPQVDFSPQTDEEKIIAFLKTNGRINNATCRDLLSVSFDRASYLLKKMHAEGVLSRHGRNRGARYHLAESSADNR